LIFAGKPVGQPQDRVHPLYDAKDVAAAPCDMRVAASNVRKGFEDRKLSWGMAHRKPGTGCRVVLNTGTNIVQHRTTSSS
jgi:hypothetical protein